MREASCLRMSERNLVSLIRKVPAISQVEKLIPKFLADSIGLEENDSLKTLFNEMLNDLLFKNPSDMEKENLQHLEIESIEVFNVWVRSATISGACLTLDFVCDCAKNGEPYELVEDIMASGDLVTGVAAENVVRVASVLTIDVLNNKYVLGLDEIDLCTLAPPEVRGDENGFIPYGRISQYSYLPFSLTLKKSYGKLSKGAELTLNSERLVYEDKDKVNEEVIPVEIVETILNTSLSDTFGSNPLFKIQTAMIRSAYPAADEDGEENEFPTINQLGKFLSETQGGSGEIDDDIFKGLFEDDEKN
jgi:hypothetical protein